MRRLVLSAALLCAVLSGAGCYRYAVKVGQGGDIKGEPARSEWAHHFIAGAVGDETIDVSDVCPSGNATVKIERNVIDAVLGNIVGNVLWQPSTVEVYCGDGRTAAVLLDERSGPRFARSDAFADAVAELAPGELPVVLAYQER